MIRVERTIDETYTVPLRVLRRKLGLGAGRLNVETREQVAGQAGRTTMQRDVVQYDDVEGGVIKFQVRRHESEARPNR